MNEKIILSICVFIVFSFSTLFSQNKEIEICENTTADITNVTFPANTDLANLLFYEDVALSQKLKNPQAVGAGIYYIKYTVGSIPNNVMEVEVKELKLPVISDIALSNYCEADKIGALSIPSITDPSVIVVANSGKWTLDGVDIDPNTYELTYGDNGKLIRYEVETTTCGIVSSKAVSLVVNKLPQITKLLPVQDICLGNTISAEVIPNHYTLDANTIYSWAIDGNTIQGQNTNTFSYEPTMADSGKVLSVSITNDCGTKIFYKSVKSEGVMTTPTNSVFPSPVETDGMTFPIVYGADFVDPTIGYASSTNTYRFITRDDSGTYTDGGNTTITYNGQSFNCIVSVVPNGVMIEATLTTNSTLFLDKGTYYPPASRGQSIFSKAGMKIIGTSTDASNPSCIGPNYHSVYSRTGHVLYRFANNMLFENIVFDGEKMQFYGNATASGAGSNYKNNYNFITLDNSTYGIIFNKVKFRNIGASSTGVSTSRHVINILDHNNRRYRSARYFLDVTIEGSILLHPSYAPINTQTTDNLYFRNLSVEAVTGYVRSIDIANSTSAYDDKSGGEDIIFAGTLNIPANKQIRVMHYDSRMISFPTYDYRYMKLSTNYISGSYLAGTAAIEVYPNQSLFDSQTTVNNVAYFDAKESVFVVKNSMDATKLFDNLRILYNNVGIAKECKLPPLNIKLIQNSSGSIGGFTLPDFGEIDANIAAMSGYHNQPMSQSTLLPYSSTPIVFPTTNSDYIKLYNVDFSNDYHLLDAVIDGGNSIANSHASNFYNCSFKTYAEEDDMEIRVEDVNFKFKDQAMKCDDVSFDLKDLTLESGSVSGLTLTYYDEDLVELQDTKIRISGDYHIKGIGSLGCEYVDMVSVSFVSPALAKPVVIDNFEYCHGDIASAYIFLPKPEKGMTYKWKRVVGYDLGLDQKNGYDTIPEFKAINEGILPLEAIYQVVLQDTVGEYICQSEPAMFMITVNPLPQMLDIKNRVYCNNSTVSEFTFTSNVADATYTWKRIGGDAINNLPESGYGVMPQFNAVNNTNNLIKAEYEVLATYNFSQSVCGEGRETRKFTITILPDMTVSIDNAEQTICSREEILPITFSSNVTDPSINIVYNWSLRSGNVGLPANGEGDIAAVELSNYTLTPVTAVYEVVPEYVSDDVWCSGQPKSFYITVKSDLTGGDVDAGMVCSGEVFDYTHSATITNATFSWTRIADADINGGKTSSGTSKKISEKLINISGSPITVKYVYDVKSDLCSTSDVVSVVVNPAIDFKVLTFDNFICSSEVEVEIPYTTTAAAGSLEYALEFSNEALNAGFENTYGYSSLPANYITIPLPANISGTFYGNILIKNSCEIKVPFSITVEDGNIDITRQPVSQTDLCPKNSDIYLSVIAVGSNLKYQWYHNSVAIPGATKDVYTVEFDTKLVGQYYVVVNNDCGSVISDEVEVTENGFKVYEKWRDVLYVNDPNHEFTRFQWYKNGIAINKEGYAQYYSDKGGLNGTYYVRGYYADNSYIETCPAKFVNGVLQAAYLIYPRLLNQGESFKVEANGVVVDSSSKTYVEIYTISGNKVARYEMKNNLEEIPSPSSSGIFIVRVLDSNSNVTIEKVIVK